ncbi:aminotransferase class V-fold PLP-dependent enzyme [Desulfurispirillum indicum]|uniref:aminotransferase class V-fold PLP-dependent enzyme n=1 Tax=Desulfurispirillum indicum TaxID=936456 RepID=UPI001CF9CD48|nr:aminotransferase class V-fold PLP-dependent enzyme [Desulfurispirillum indicum]UCZ56407.1 aminotransferase class V-fold PLP-dependent enzyme [Desulfurispirillum indicum]
MKNLFRRLLPSEHPFQELRQNVIKAPDTYYFDFTATGLGYQPIEERIAEAMQDYANTHSKIARSAALTSSRYDVARSRLKDFLGINNEFALLPCGNGSTAAMKKFQELLGIYIPPATRKRLGIAIDPEQLPVFLIGPQEHHSNEISLRETGATVIRIPLNAQGTIDLDTLRAEAARHAHRQIIGSFSTASNVSGDLLPWEEVSRIIRQHQGLVCFDMAASSPYMNIDNSLYDAAFLSPHKLLGGPGSCGLLAIRRTLVDTSLPPTFGGGGTVGYVSRQQHDFVENLEQREDAGTPGILQLLRASFAYQLRNEVGFAFMEQRKNNLSSVFLEGLGNIGSHTIYGPAQDIPRISTFALNFEGVSPYSLCEHLSELYRIETRPGCSCAGPYGHDLLNMPDDHDLARKPAWLRVSIHYTHSLEDVEYLLESLRKAVNALRGREDQKWEAC